MNLQDFYRALADGKKLINDDGSITYQIIDGKLLDEDGDRNIAGLPETEDEASEWSIAPEKRTEIINHPGGTLELPGVLCKGLPKGSYEINKTDPSDNGETYQSCHIKLIGPYINIKQPEKQKLYAYLVQDPHSILYVRYYLTENLTYLRAPEWDRELGEKK